VISQEKNLHKKIQGLSQDKRKSVSCGPNKTKFYDLLGQSFEGFEVFMLCLFCTKYRSLLQAMHKSSKGRFTRRVFFV
jgi:hypothetical protein